MNPLMLDSPEATILSRVIAPESAALSPAVAAEFLRWNFSDTDQQRMTELANRARQGVLTAEEQAEVDGYERVSSFLGLVKSKARQALRGLSVNH